MSSISVIPVSATGETAAEMITRLTGEGLKGLGVIARQYPGNRGADRLHPATLTRWILKGIISADGRRVKLDAVRVGHRWLTSEAAVTRFFAALADAPTTEAPATRAPAVRRREVERAEAAFAKKLAAV